MPRRILSVAMTLWVTSACLYAAQPEDTGIQCQPVLLVQVAVSDLDQAIAFYTEKLGFELESVQPEIEWARIKTGIQGVTIGLGRQDKVEGSGTVSMNFGVDDIDKARTILEPQGVEFVGPNITIPGVVRLATLLDPDGNRIRLASHPGVNKHNASQAESEAAEINIKNLAWIAGTWRGELFGSHAEEHWSKPEANHMLGVFRMWKDDGPRLYELCELVETGESGDTAVHFRFKHINAITLDQWETDKPLELLCTDLTGTRAVFTATSDEQLAVTEMIFEREDDQLRISVHGKHDNGESFEFTAEYTRHID